MPSTTNDNAIGFAGFVQGHQLAGNIISDTLWITLKRITPATTASRSENNSIAFFDPHIINF